MLLCLITFILVNVVFLIGSYFFCFQFCLPLIWSFVYLPPASCDISELPLLMPWIFIQLSARLILKHVHSCHFMGYQLPEYNVMLFLTSRRSRIFKGQHVWIPHLSFVAGYTSWLPLTLKSKEINGMLFLPSSVRCF